MSKEERPRIRWDEETIALHDKDRGTRMKIEEPNTPYHYYAEEEDVEAAGDAVASGGIEINEVTMAMHDAHPDNAMKPTATAATAANAVPVSPARSASNGQELKWDELQARLHKHQRQSEWDSDSDASSTSSHKKIHKTPGEKAFAQKRKQHYNEFERMKQWRQQHANDDDDEDEEDEVNKAAKQVQK